MLLLSVLTIAQQPPKKSQSAREDLIQKSKNQKTTGFLLLGIGAAASVGGATIFTNNFTIFGKGDDNAVTGGAVLFLAGTLSVLGSIPFFIALVFLCKQLSILSDLSKLAKLFFRLLFQ